MKKITIIVATISNAKIDGIKKAFEKFYSPEEYSIKILSGKTESGVPNQPFGNDTYQGAYNRINNIRKKYEEKINESELNVDYYISCEAGIDNTNKVLVNGELQTIYSGEQIVCIFDPKNEEYTFAKSSSWTIPNEDIEEIKNTDLDQYLRKRGCTGLDDIGNGKYISRNEAVMEATQSAIASVLFKERNKKNLDFDIKKDIK